MKKKHSQVIEAEAKAKPEVIILGLDLHVRQGYRVPAIGRFDAQAGPAMGPWKLLDQIGGTLP